MKIILASKSPRRKELLSRLCPEFEVLPAEADESLPQGTPPERGVEILARRKGEAVAHAIEADPASADAIILSSDTLVELSGEPLGKPKDEEDAARMLRALSGKTHYVRTGVAVFYRGKTYSGVASTAVTFRTLTEEEILAYIRTGEPMDKAGAYGIQGEGGRLVASYDGDFDTVVGLSLKLTRELMDRALSEGGATV